MDKDVKKIEFDPEKKSLTIEFTDGSKYGEIGSIAVKTFEVIKTYGNKEIIDKIA